MRADSCSVFSTWEKISHTVYVVLNFWIHFSGSWHFTINKSYLRRVLFLTKFRNWLQNTQKTALFDTNCWLKLESINFTPIEIQILIGANGVVTVLISNLQDFIKHGVIYNNELINGYKMSTCMTFYCQNQVNFHLGIFHNTEEYRYWKWIGILQAFTFKSS